MVDVSRKVANQRQNFVHQETTRIISGNSTVVTEKLEVKNMSAKVLNMVALFTP